MHQVSLITLGGGPGFPLRFLSSAPRSRTILLQYCTGHFSNSHSVSVSALYYSKQPAFAVVQEAVAAELDSAA